MKTIPQRTFCGLPIAFDNQVLEPRSWTEDQSGWAAELLDGAPTGPVLELCAGVGHIGLGAVRDSDRHLVMVDVNPAAERFARENAAANGMGARVEFRLGRIDAALGADERFSLIVGTRHGCHQRTARPTGERSHRCASLARQHQLRCRGSVGSARARPLPDVSDDAGQPAGGRPVDLGFDLLVSHHRNPCTPV